MSYRENIRRQLSELRSDSFRLANSIEGLRQGCELATPGSFGDTLKLAAMNCEIAANLLKRARLELELSATVRGTHVDTIDDVGEAIEADAQAFPVCPMCEHEPELCACSALEEE